VALIVFGDTTCMPSRVQCVGAAFHMSAMPPCCVLVAEVANTVYPCPRRVWRPWHNFVSVSIAMSVLRSAMARSASRSFILRADTTLYVVSVMWVCSFGALCLGGRGAGVVSFISGSRGMGVGSMVIGIGIGGGGSACGVVVSFISSSGGRGIGSMVIGIGIGGGGSACIVVC